MFAKLLKHDWRATAGTLGILSLAALGASLLAGGALFCLTRFDEELTGMAVAGLALSMVFLCLALVAYSVAVQIIQLVRFYKSRFTDEGYLTFTLPVNSHQIFLSAFLNMLIWSVLSSVVLIVSVGLILLIGLPWDQINETMGQIQQAQITELLEEIYSFYGFKIDGTFIGFQILQIIVNSLYGIVMMLTCITVGAVAAKKHKIIAAFVAYYVISFLTGMVGNILSVGTSIDNMDHYLSSMLGSAADSMQSMYQMALQNMSLTIVWEIVLIVAGYFLSTYLMKRKLNLP